MSVSDVSAPARTRCAISLAICVGVVVSLGHAVLHAEPTPGPAATEMDAVRSSYLELRRDTLMAVAMPVVPGAGEIAVYVTVAADANATLQDVSLAINDAVVCRERFSDAQLQALTRGAAGRLYVATMPQESPHLTITLAGLRHDGEPWVQVAAIELPASDAPRYVEFQLARTSTNGIPDIVSRVSS